MSRDTLLTRHTAGVSGREAPAAVTAYRAMHALILNNEWPPGFQVTEVEAAELFVMSRTPVREAFMLLERDGLVEIVSRRGLRVLPVSPDDMREIYQVVTSLEATAAELVASIKPSDADLASLEEATSAMTVALEADDLVAWAEADERFHSELLVLCGNSTLAAVVTNCWGRMHRVRMITLRMRPKPDRSTQEHRALVEALRRGDPQAAGTLHRAHRQLAGEELVALLERFGLRTL